MNSLLSVPDATQDNEVETMGMNHFTQHIVRSSHLTNNRKADKKKINLSTQTPHLIQHPALH